MSGEEKMRCYNRGCGKEYTEKENASGESRIQTEKSFLCSEKLKCKRLSKLTHEYELVALVPDYVQLIFYK